MIPLLLLLLGCAMLQSISTACVPTPSIGAFVAYSNNATHITMSCLVKEIGPYSWIGIGLNRQVGGMGMGNVNNPSTFYIGHFTAAQQFQLREGKAVGLYLPEAEATNYAQATMEIKDGLHNFTISRKLEAPTTAFDGYFAVPQNGQYDVLIAFSNQQTASDAINKHFRAERFTINLNENTENCAGIQNPTGNSPKPNPQQSKPVQPQQSTTKPIPQESKQTPKPVPPVNTAGLIRTSGLLLVIAFLAHLIL